jgi:hypothetical protein
MSGVVILVGSVLGGVLVVGVYLWYAAALAKLFPRLGAPAWRGWVPIVNEAEILGLGGYPRWTVVFLLVPIVSICGVVLRAVAAHRIGRRLDHGAGATVLAVLLPPVWASLLAWGPGPQTAGRVTAEQRIETSSTTDVRSRYATQSAATRPADTAPATAPVSIAVPPGIAPAPAAPVVSDPPVLAPLVAPPLPPTPTLVTPPASVIEAPAPAVLTPPPVATTASRFQDPSRASPPEPTPIVDTAPADDDDDDELAETIVVDRRPAPQYELALDDGPAYPLESAAVILGRHPTGDDPSVHYLAVRDTTRTLSKLHARLDLVDDGWRIGDLGSTNGVVVLADDGSEQPIGPGASLDLDGRRFVLGRVAMRVRPIGETA